MSKYQKQKLDQILKTTNPILLENILNKYLLNHSIITKNAKFQQYALQLSRQALTNPHCPPNILQKIIINRSLYIPSFLLHSVICHKNFPTKMFNYMLRSHSSISQKELALSYCPSNLIHKFIQKTIANNSFSRHTETIFNPLREAILNPNCSSISLSLIINNPNIPIYYKSLAATSCNCTPDILKNIIENANPEITAYALRNRNCTPDILKLALTNNIFPNVAVQHPNCPPDALFLYCKNLLPKNCPFPLAVKLANLFLSNPSLFAALTNNNSSVYVQSLINNSRKISSLSNKLSKKRSSIKSLITLTED